MADWAQSFIRGVLGWSLIGVRVLQAEGYIARVPNDAPVYLATVRARCVAVAERLESLAVPMLALAHSIAVTGADVRCRRRIRYSAHCAY